MDWTRYSVRRGLKAGALGGIVGTLVPGLLAWVKRVCPRPGSLLRCNCAEARLSFSKHYRMVLYFVFGIVGESLFIATTAIVQRFDLDTRRKSFWVGLLAGIVIWVLVYVPVSDLLAPSDLSNLMFAGGSVVFHLVYGVVTALVSLWLIRRTVKPTLTR